MYDISNIQHHTTTRTKFSVRDPAFWCAFSGPLKFGSGGLVSRPRQGCREEKSEKFKIQVSSSTAPRLFYDCGDGELEGVGEDVSVLMFEGAAILRPLLRSLSPSRGKKKNCHES